MVRYSACDLGLPHDTGPGVDQIHNTVPVDWDILFGYHLDRLLRDHTT